jgi:8-oxo-dGTP pyrophosphatase MutT (NUDIX family)
LPHQTKSSGFLRHVRACNNAVLPGERLPFRIGADRVGWVKPAFAAHLAAFPAIEMTADAVTLTQPAALPEIARTLSERGLFRRRKEEFDVRAHPEGPPLARIDRGAIPSFGILAQGVHVNGLVQRADGLHVWVARRAPDKALDPGKLDHIVAGGVSAGMGPRDTLIKEAAEEAGIPAGLAAQAQQVGAIRYAMERPEGLRRDVVYCYDLLLPEAFKPRAEDGEVEAFELWPLARVLDSVRDTDAFKFNVNLVLIDLFIRQGLIAGQDAERLRAAL